MKYTKYVREHFNSYDFPIFRHRDLELIRGLSRVYLKLLLHKMLSSDEITRITRGVYTFHKDADVLCFAFSPSYYGLEDALSIRHFSEQGTNPMVLTPRNVRRGTRSFRGRNYLVYNIDRQFFFGYRFVKRGNFWIPVSDLEKTIIDMFYFKLHIRDELWRNILPSLDEKILKRYLKRYDNKFASKLLTELEKAKAIYTKSKSDKYKNHSGLTKS